MSEVFAQGLVRSARACLGTPFHHQGRKKGVGLDCIGLIVVALTENGYVVRDRADYGLRPEKGALVQALEAHGARRVDGFEAGDVLVFVYDGQPQHVALASSGETLIHAFAPVGAVVESGVSTYWRRRFWGAYRFYGAF